MMTPAFNGMIANLLDLDKQRTPGPWRKSHEAVGAPGNVAGNPQHLPLVAECDTDFGMYKTLGPLQAGKNARFIVALENAWPKIVAALCPSSDLPAATVQGAGEPVAWRIRIREGSKTLYAYTERLPFEPDADLDITVLGQPEALALAALPEQDASK